MQINFNINSQILINSPLEQFEVTSLLGINAPIFGYLNIIFNTNFISNFKFTLCRK